MLSQNFFKIQKGFFVSLKNAVKVKKWNLSDFGIFLTNWPNITSTCHVVIKSNFITYSTSADPEVVNYMGWNWSVNNLGYLGNWDYSFVIINLIILWLWNFSARVSRWGKWGHVASGNGAPSSTTRSARDKDFHLQSFPPVKEKLRKSLQEVSLEIESLALNKTV